MLTQLKGVVASISERVLVLDVWGVGYEVFVTRDTATKFKTGTEVTLYTYFVVREDAQELYGFLSTQDRDFFKLLRTVSGIGPKSALNILDIATPEDIRRAVVEQNAESLQAVNGIGKKTAEKIVVELKDKIAGVLPSPASSDDAAVLEAIVSLGYSAQEVRGALKAITDKQGTLEDKVKSVLKSLSRG